MCKNKQNYSQEKKQKKKLTRNKQLFQQPKPLKIKEIKSFPQFPQLFYSHIL